MNYYVCGCLAKVPSDGPPLAWTCPICRYEGDKALYIDAQLLRARMDAALFLVRPTLWQRIKNWFRRLLARPRV